MKPKNVLVIKTHSRLAANHNQTTLTLNKDGKPLVANDYTTLIIKVRKGKSLNHNETLLAVEK